MMILKILNGFLAFLFLACVIFLKDNDADKRLVQFGIGVLLIANMMFLP